ncbi:MAG: cellulase [Sphingobium sp.]|nr:MAG: cellulase [Sphingobium sp.]
MQGRATTIRPSVRRPSPNSMLLAACLTTALSGCGGDDGGGQSSASPVQISATPASESATAAVATTTAPSTGTTVSSAAASAVPVATPTSATIYRGINISGGEFGGPAPGRMGTNYIYPTKAEIDYYAALGFKILRFPFLWERLQPVMYGALSSADQQALREVVNYATAKGMIVILDMHNYAQRSINSYTTKVDIGSSQAPVSALVDGWVKIAYEWRYNGKVWIGLMNEPHTMTPEVWWPIAKRLITDLRARDIWNKLLVPGTSWSGAHSWVTSGNAANATGIKDPANNYAIEVHQYLDADSSGTSSTCVVGSGSRVDTAINWAKSKGGIKLFMGEMGGSGEAQCGIEYRTMLNKMEQSGVFLGWTAWGGGTWWNANYPFRTLTTSWPSTATKTPHLTYLVEYLPQ